MKRGIFFWVLALFLTAGCATAPTIIEKQEAAAPVVKSAEEGSAAAPRLFEERDLLLEGVALLNLTERPAPEKARSIFLSLSQRYPQSRWRLVAEAFIRLIDEKNASLEASRMDHLLVDKTRAERLKALQENDQLKKAVREVTEKLQSEMAVLAQENEQLRRDIQRLKALEIELQKRERMLR